MEIIRQQNKRGERRGRKKSICPSFLNVIISSHMCPHQGALSTCRFNPCYQVINLLGVYKRGEGLAPV